MCSTGCWTTAFLLLGDGWSGGNGKGPLESEPSKLSKPASKNKFRHVSILQNGQHEVFFMVNVSMSFLKGDFAFSGDRTVWILRDTWWCAYVAPSHLSSLMPKRCKVSLEPETSVYKWLFQLDDSEPLHKKKVVSPCPSTWNWLFGVPRRQHKKWPSENQTCQTHCSRSGSWDSNVPQVRSALIKLLLSTYERSP